MILEGCLRKGRNEIYSEVFDDYIDIDDIKGAIKSVDKLFDRTSSDLMPALLRSVVEALLKIQSNKTYHSASENDCNSYVRDLLETGRYICKD